MTTTTTNITVRLRPRKRLPLLRVHGILAPFTAMINMVLFVLILGYLFFKYAALAVYLGGRGIYRTSSRLRRKARYPRTTAVFDWTQEK